jgi:Ni/Fe-hydrogenase subunit HybB-like protein
MTVLTAVMLVGANAWAWQVVHGMAVTGMSDHVSWGLYIANFTFAVGLAAGGVMMVIPAYLYHDHDMHDVVIIGELLAVAAIAMALGFVVVDLGRPDRAWHILPFIGKFHWPVSMLTWDVIVLNGYLALNLHVCGYLVYTRYLGAAPRPRWYVPFVFLSIIWAISIHTVTAFLYAGLGGRPFWNSALLAPRFLASAFVTGPAFIVLSLQLVRRFTRLQGPRGGHPPAARHPPRGRAGEPLHARRRALHALLHGRPPRRRGALPLARHATATTSSCPGCGPPSRSTSAPWRCSSPHR